MAEGSGGVGLSAAGQAEAEDVVGALEELAGRELVELGEDGARKPVALERLEGLVARQARGPEQALGATLRALVGLGLEDLEQRRERRVVARVGEAAHDFGGEGRQLESRSSSRMRVPVSIVKSLTTHLRRAGGRRRRGLAAGCAPGGRRASRGRPAP